MGAKNSKIAANSSSEMNQVTSEPSVTERKLVALVIKVLAEQQREKKIALQQSLCQKQRIALKRSVAREFDFLESESELSETSSVGSTAFSSSDYSDSDYLSGDDDVSALDDDEDLSGGIQSCNKSASEAGYWALFATEAGIGNNFRPITNNICEAPKIFVNGEPIAGFSSDTASGVVLLGQPQIARVNNNKYFTKNNNQVQSSNQNSSKNKKSRSQHRENKNKKSGEKKSRAEGRSLRSMRSERRAARSGGVLPTVMSV